MRFCKNKPFRKINSINGGNWKMTDSQRAMIRQLRLDGVGYKGIAAQLNLSRDVVRNFCKKNGLEGDGVVVDLNFEVKKQTGVLCMNCAKPLGKTKRGRAKRFCSEPCRRSWWKENPDKKTMKASAMYKMVCPCCGQEFISYGNKNRKYCSHECYIKDRFG